MRVTAYNCTSGRSEEKLKSDAVGNAVGLKLLTPTFCKQFVPLQQYLQQHMWASVQLAAKKKIFLVSFPSSSFR
jgi:hypothetical protein